MHRGGLGKTGIKLFKGNTQTKKAMVEQHFEEIWGKKIASQVFCNHATVPQVSRQ